MTTLYLLSGARIVEVTYVRPAGSRVVVAIGNGRISVNRSRLFEKREEAEAALERVHVSATQSSAHAEASYVSTPSAQPERIGYSQSWRFDRTDPAGDGWARR